MSGWGCTACGGENPAGTRFCGHCATPNPGFDAATTNPDSPLAAALASLPGGAAGERLAEGGDRIGDESRLVTALFADISGFTSLGDELEDAEALHEIVAPVIARLAAIAERYDGFIAKYAGDALLVFFGAPVAHEDDAARALLVAVEMHQAMPAIVADLPKDAAGLELHVGVNTGRVVSGRFGGEIRSHYSILGDAVNISQRLEAAAPAGETYVGQATYDQASAQFEFELVGDLTVKGKRRPVKAWRLVGERRLAPLSGTSLARPSAPFVGREHEVASIDAVLGAVRGGRGGVVTVSGGAGVGKSRLLAEVRSRAASGGFSWYQARCLSYGAGLPYWPFADLVRQVVGITPDDASDAAATRLSGALEPVPGAAPYIARLLGLPTGDDGVSALDPEAFRHGLHRAFVDVVQHTARALPIVLAIEDVHWADTSTVELCADIAAALNDFPAVVYVTGRNEGREAIERIADASSGPAVAINLRPLSERGAIRLAESLLGGDLPPELAASLSARTGCNPFFVEELLRAVRDHGLLTKRDGRWYVDRTWEAALPDTVERLLSARIDLLPPAAASVLQSSAVIGRLIRRSLLAAVLGDREPELDAAVDTLVTAGFLDPAVDSGEDAVMFHHALQHEVAYQRLLAKQRRDLHLRVADVAERLYGSGDKVIDLLARHLYLGEAGARATGYLVRAGERAKRLFANAEAVVHFERAAEISQNFGDTERVSDLLVEIGALERLRGDYDRALVAYEKSRDAKPSARAGLGVAATHRNRGEYDEALEALDAAEAEASGEDLARVWLERASIHAASGRNEQACAASLAGLEAVPDRRTALAAELLVPLARAELMLGRREQALGHTRGAAAVLEHVTDATRLVTLTRFVGSLFVELDRLDEAEVMLRAAFEQAERVGSTEDAAISLLNLGNVAQGRERFTDAATQYRAALSQFAHVNHRSGISAAEGNLGYALAKLGALDEAEVHCRRSVDIADAIGAAPTAAESTHSLATIALLRGDRQRAAELGEAAAARWEAVGAVEAAAACRSLANEALNAERAGP